MKSKKGTYLLIASLLAVWGIIGFKMMANFETEKIISKNNYVLEKQENNLTIDSFTISANYEDPFRVKYFKRAKPSKIIATISTIKKVQKPKEKKVKKPIVKPTVSHIKYYGIIKNSNTSKAVGILYINDLEVLVSVGSEIKDGKIISIQEDNLKLLYKEQVFELEKE